MKIRNMKIGKFLIKVFQIDEKPKRDLLFIFFSVVGLLCDVGLFNILKNELLFGDWVANGISYPIGVVITFILNFFFNYCNKTYPGLRFALVLSAHGMSWGLQMILMYKFSVTKLITIIINGILMWFTKLFFKDSVIINIIKFWQNLKRFASNSDGLQLELDA